MRAMMDGSTADTVLASNHRAQLCYSALSNNGANLEGGICCNDLVVNCN